jgi:NAD(P)-dependent dehydrogenase (short-subunit alcohol dehydrogenase family)
VILSDTSEEELKHKLSSIGAIGGFIHLNALLPTNELAEQNLRSIFLIAKHLKNHLNSAARISRSWWMSITRMDGCLGLGKNSTVNPIDGGYFGLTKTLNLECPQVFCRAIDLHPDLDTSTAVRSIIDELSDPNRHLVEVGYSSVGRCTIVADRSRVNIKDNPSPKIDRRSVLLVTGGARGITAKCAIELARKFHCQLILIGRSSITTEWDNLAVGIDDRELKSRLIQQLIDRVDKPTPVRVQKILQSIHQAREIRDTLAQIERVGGLAEYIRADITDLTSIRAHIQQITAKFGAITGIIHGAGNLADKLIENKTIQDLETVYNPKIIGLSNILNCIDIDRLQHLSLFSSVAAFYGNIGQSDYAIANDILNKFAHRYQSQYPQCQVISFNWGPWDSGMVTEELKKVFSDRQVELIPSHLGANIFIDALSIGTPSAQITVGGGLVRPTEDLSPELQQYRIQRKLSLEYNPILCDHQIGNKVVLPVTFSVNWMASICEQLYLGYKFFQCADYQVLKGIIFDETLADEYAIDIQEIEKIDRQSIELFLTISSRTSTGKVFYHYRSKLKLLKDLPPQPSLDRFDLEENINFANLSPYQNGTLFHGKAFQGVQKVLNIASNKLTMVCILASTSDRSTHQIPMIPMNPIEADMAFQSMVIWVRHYYDSACLPLRCQKGEYFQRISEGEFFYVFLEVVTSNETKLIANVTYHDREGKIYSRVFGAEVTISPHLNSLFVQTLSQETSL